MIGDTPLDIACAAAGGARSIGVATGSHSVSQLRDAGADEFIVRDDSANVPAESKSTVDRTAVDSARAGFVEPDGVHPTIAGVAPR